MSSEISEKVKLIDLLKKNFKLLLSLLILTEISRKQKRMLKKFLKRLIVMELS